MTILSICPACLGTFRTTKAGRMNRHGFRAHNVRHGESTGFHTGSCPGTSVQPIGTAEGNAYAHRYAERLEARATELEWLPTFTTADALRLQIQKAQDSVLGGSTYRPRVITAEQRAAYSTPEAFSRTSVRGWFSSEQIEWLRTQMVKERLADIEGRRAHATLLRAAVAARPSVALAA